MIDAKWGDDVMDMSKHKLREAVEKLNKEAYHSAEDIRKYKDAYKALYYLLSIEKANK